jgi:hypothetical protein
MIYAIFSTGITSRVATTGSFTDADVERNDPALECRVPVTNTVSYLITP